MSGIVDRLNEFVAWVGTLKGDEKGEAQVSCDRLFRAFGHGGFREANATLEDRIRTQHGLPRRGTIAQQRSGSPRLSHHVIQFRDRGGGEPVPP